MDQHPPPACFFISLKVCEWSPSLYGCPQLSFLSTSHPSTTPAHPQIWKHVPVITPSIYLLSMPPLQTRAPAPLLLLTPITPHTKGKFLSSKSDHPKACWKLPLQCLPGAWTPSHKCLPPVPPAHTAGRSSLNMPSCFTPACKGRPSSSCLHGQPNPIHLSVP